MCATWNALALGTKRGMHRCAPLVHLVSAPGPSVIQPFCCEDNRSSDDGSSGTDHSSQENLMLVYPRL